MGASGDCTTTFDLCKDGTYCNANACKVTPVLGATCDPGNDFCVDGYCDSVTSKCTLRLADGSSCTADTMCNSYSCNASGKCEASSKSYSAP